MLDYRNIQPLSGQERAEREARIAAAEEMAHQRMLEDLDAWEWEPTECGGKPPIVLPPEIARRVLDDVRAGHSDRAIAKKYAATRYAFSYRWLNRAKKDGRLERMAGLGQLVGQNL